MSTLSPTGTTPSLPTSLAPDASVLRGVLVPSGAMSLTGLRVGAVLNSVVHVVRLTTPSQVIQSIVQGVRVGVVTGLFPRCRRTNEGREDQSMNLMYLTRAPRQGDASPALSDHRLHRLPLEATDSAVSMLYGSVQGSDVSLIGDLVSTFVSGDREPSFVTHGAESTSVPTTGTHYL